MAIPRFILPAQKKHQNVVKLLLAKGAREKEIVRSSSAERPASTKGQSTKYTAVVSACQKLTTR